MPPKGRKSTCELAPHGEPGKVCNKCDPPRRLTFASFSKMRSAPDGLQAICKDCYYAWTLKNPARRKRIQTRAASKPTNSRPAVKSFGQKRGFEKRLDSFLSGDSGVYRPDSEACALRVVEFLEADDGVR